MIRTLFTAILAALPAVPASAAEWKAAVAREPSLWEAFTTGVSSSDPRVQQAAMLIVLILAGCAMAGGLFAERR